MTSAMRTTWTPLRLSKSFHCREQCLAEGSGFPVEVDMLHAAAATDRRIVATGIERRVNHRLFLQVGAGHDQCKVERAHIKWILPIG